MKPQKEIEVKMVDVWIDLSAEAAGIIERTAARDGVTEVEAVERLLLAARELLDGVEL